MYNHDGLNRQNAFPLNEFDQVDAPSHVSEYPCTLFQAVMKISTDNGKTFGPMLKLAANGTIGSSSGG
jgi:hypothetical protein